MLQNFWYWWTFSWVWVKHFLHQLFKWTLFYLLLKQCGVFYWIDDFSRIFSNKGNISINHLIEYDPKRPNINLLIINPRFKYFRRHIIAATTKSPPSPNASSKPKINNFGMKMLIKQNSFCFQITMYYFSWMNILYCLAYSPKNRSNMF